MGFWDTVKDVYKKVDEKVGGYLPGGVKPGSSSKAPSTPSSSGSSSSALSSSGGSSSGRRSSGGGGGGGGSVTYTTTPPQQLGGVIVTDYTTGESVTTRHDPSGRITSQSYSSGGSGGGITPSQQIGESQAIETASQPGGLVYGTTQSAGQIQPSQPETYTQELYKKPSFLENLKGFFSFDTSTAMATTISAQQLGGVRAVDYLEKPEVVDGQTIQRGGSVVVSGQNIWDFPTKDVMAAGFGGKELEVEPSVQTITREKMGRRTTLGGVGLATLGVATSFMPKMAVFEEGKASDWSMTPGKGTAWEGVTQKEWLIGTGVVVAPALINLPSAFTATKEVYKTSGATGVAKEIIGQASPLSLASRTYAAPASFKNIRSAVSPSGKTMVYGEAQPGATLRGMQTTYSVGGKTVAGGTYRVQQEFIKISGGGARIQTGALETIRPYITQPISSGTGVYVKSISGGKIIFKDGITAYTSQTYASGGLTGYSTSGEAYLTSSFNKVITTRSPTGTVYRPTKQPGIYKFLGGKTITIKGLPSGKYRVSPEMAGIQVRMRELGLEGTGKVIRGSGKKSSPEYLQSIYQKQIVKTTPPAIIGTGNTAVKQIQTTGIAAVTTVSQVKTIQATPQSTQTRTAVVPRLEFAHISKMFTQETTEIGKAFGSTTRAIPSISTAPAIVTTQKQKQSSAFKTTSSLRENFLTPGAVVTPATLTPPGRTPIFPVPLLGISPGGLALPSAVVSGGEKVVRYSPSFSALLYNIRGAAPKTQAKTGIGFRPITKGFRFQTGLFNFKGRFF